LAEKEERRKEMTIDLESEFSAINKKLNSLQEFAEEIHRIVKSLHEQWNTPSNMDIPVEALKEKTDTIGETTAKFRETDPKQLYR
jgi:hypothetical protein